MLLNRFLCFDRYRRSYLLLLRLCFWALLNRVQADLLQVRIAFHRVQPRTSMLEAHLSYLGRYGGHFDFVRRILARVLQGSSFIVWLGRDWVIGEVTYSDSINRLLGFFTRLRRHNCSQLVDVLRLSNASILEFQRQAIDLEIERLLIINDASTDHLAVSFRFCDWICIS